MVEKKLNKINSNKIQGFGIPSLVYPLMVSSFLGMATTVMNKIAGVDMPLSILIGLVIGMVPLFLSIFILSNSNGKDITELNKEIFGKVIGTILNVILNVFIIFYSSLILYNLTLFFDVQYMPETNSLFIHIIMCIPIVYAISKDIASVTRLSQCLMILGIVIFLIAAFGLIGDVSLEKLQPVLSNGIFNPLKSACVFCIFATLPLFFLTTIPTRCEASAEKRNKRLILMYFISGLVIFLIYFITMGALGESMVSIYKYPEYIVLKKISILFVIERIENTVALYFVFCMLMFIIFLMQFLNRNVEKLIPKFKYKQIIPYILGAILVTISYKMFPNSLIAESFTQKYVPYIMIVVLFGGMVLTSIGIIVKKLQNSKK